MLFKQDELVVVLGEKVKKATSLNCGDEDKTLLNSQPVYRESRKQPPHLPTSRVIGAVPRLRDHLSLCITVDREHTRAYHIRCQFSRMRSPSEG
jgi:hypothetical protein